MHARLHYPGPLRADEGGEVLLQLRAEAGGDQGHLKADPLAAAGYLQVHAVRARKLQEKLEG